MLPFLSRQITTTFIFVRNDFKEIVGDKDSQGSQTDFDWQKRGKINRNPHQDIDRYDDFFFRSRAIDLVSESPLHKSDKALYDKASLQNA